mmetsp:Transcript_42741/g.118006  ORF Transcript_42741/g.118006 Transcript_42741/m.118006 type:complete len:263 (-) Transcript_42741:257-1045(-)
MVAAAAPPTGRERIRRIKWSRLLKPGSALRLPHLAGAALRLTAAVLPEPSDDVSQTNSGDAVELRLCVASLGSATARGSGAPLTLARLGGSGGAAQPSFARMRVLVGCSEGGVLSVEGGSVWVSGRLEGIIPADWASASETTPVETSGTSGPAPLAPPSAKARPKAKIAAGVVAVQRPKSEAEYIDWIYEYLRVNGRTSLRRLGDVVPRPSDVNARTLKARLLKHRAWFIVDLHGSVEINHARRWRWRTQAAVTRVRKLTTS